MRSKEELANVLSHFMGLLLSIAALAVMIIASSKNGTPLDVVSCTIFGASMIILYLSSTLAHFLPEGTTKERFFTLDQLVIYLLIAGTYTPLALIALSGAAGWTLFGLQWGLAIVGIIRNLRRIGDTESGVNLFDIFLYAGMGWMVLFFTGPVFRSVTLGGYLWIIAGGLFYTLGILFFRISKFRFHHFVWHVFVMAGTASHFIAIFFYVIPGNSH